MITNTKINEVTELLRALIACMVDKPAALALSAEELPGRVNWRAVVDIDDQGKVIGKKGVHIKALQFILALLGLSERIQFRLEVVQPDETNRGPENRSRIADTYDPDHAARLLEDVLDALLSQAACITAESLSANEKTALNLTSDRLAFRFVIEPDNQVDYHRLVSMCDPIGRGEAQSLLTALGTIYRAYGLREGVHFAIAPKNK